MNEPGDKTSSIILLRNIEFQITIMLHDAKVEHVTGNQVTELLDKPFNQTLDPLDGIID